MKDLVTSTRIKARNVEFWHSLPSASEWLNELLDAARSGTLETAQDAEMAKLQKDIAKLKLRGMEHDLKRKLEFGPIQDRMKTEMHAVDVESKKVKIDRDRLQMQWLDRQNRALDDIDKYGKPQPLNGETQTVVRRKDLD